MTADAALANDDLCLALELAWFSERPHVERMTRGVAAISAALARSGMRATLVGGGALEFYIPDGYQTGDIDLVVEGGTRERIHQVFTSLGLVRNGRHWIRGDLYVEVPGNRMTDPVCVVPVGVYKVQVITKEALLAERIVGFRHWKYWGHGLQSLDMLHAFRDELDEAALRQAVRKEGAEHALDLLLAIVDSGRGVDAQALDALWHGHYR